MDVFTQTALARSQARQQPIKELEVAASPPAERGPITIEERLLFAYPGGVPKAVARMLINWELPYGRDSYHTHQNAMAIYQEIERRAEAANKRGKEIEERLPGIERRLATLRAEYAGLRAQLNSPPPSHLTPREIGMMEVDQAGYTKLIAALEAEIERLRPEPARARREYEALRPLERLAGMIAGHLSRGAVSPRDFGFEYEWQICAPSVRKKREEEFRAEEERKRAEIELRRQENERFLAQREFLVSPEESERARIDALDFAGLISYLFLESQDLTLAEIKRQVAAWDHYRLVKAAVELWPESPNPTLWIAIREEIAEIATGRDEFFKRAAARLARVLHPGIPDHAVPLKQVVEAEGRELTRQEIDALDIEGLLSFIFSGKRTLEKDAPTLKAVIDATPDRPAANTLEAADNELRALGYTESSLYNYTLRRLSTLVYAGLKAPWEGN